MVLYMSANSQVFLIGEGKARVFRIGADGKPEVYADGFTQIGDLEFDKNGNLLVLQYADRSQWKGNLAGSLIQIAPNGTRTTLISAGEGLEGATLVLVPIMRYISRIKAIAQVKGNFYGLIHKPFPNPRLCWAY